MINLKDLRITLENFILMTEKRYLRKDVSGRITIRRKKKMILEKLTNGNVKAKRRNYLKIEIIE